MTGKRSIMLSRSSLVGVMLLVSLCQGAPAVCNQCQMLDGICQTGNQCRDIGTPQNNDCRFVCVCGPGQTTASGCQTDLNAQQQLPNVPVVKETVQIKVNPLDGLDLFLFGDFMQPNVLPNKQNNPPAPVSPMNTNIFQTNAPFDTTKTTTIPTTASPTTTPRASSNVQAPFEPFALPLTASGAITGASGSANGGNPSFTTQQSSPPIAASGTETSWSGSPPSPDLSGTSVSNTQSSATTYSSGGAEAVAASGTQPSSSNSGSATGTQDKISGQVPPPDMISKLKDLYKAAEDANQTQAATSSPTATVTSTTTTAITTFPADAPSTSDQQTQSAGSSASSSSAADSAGPVQPTSTAAPLAG